MKVYIQEDEEWPVLSPIPERLSSRANVEITDELWERWKNARKEFDAVQNLLRGIRDG